MNVVIQYKNIPVMGNSKCKLGKCNNIEFDKGKNKIIITYENKNQTVIYLTDNEELTTTITLKRIK